MQITNQAIRLPGSITDTDPSDNPFYYGQTPPASLYYELVGNDAVYCSGRGTGAALNQLFHDNIVVGAGDDLGRRP